MRIGLFDSGIGGLTVLRTLKRKYPMNDYIYYGDTKNLPYGDKSINELKELASKNMEFLLSKNVDMIIIACGTVSSNCLDYLKSKYSVPIISVIEPTINYLNKSNYNNIGVIATSKTIESHIFKNNINKPVYELATPKLVPLIEDNGLDNIESVLNDYLDKFTNIDALVLGCTHYPLIKDFINKKIDIIDMSEYINIPNHGNGNMEVYFSLVNDKIRDNVRRILNMNINI